MKSLVRKSLIMTIILVMVFSLAAAGAYGAEDSLVVTGYKITDSNGKEKTRISKGEVVNAEVYLKHTSIMSDYITNDTFDVSRVVDSFSGGTATAEKMDRPGGNLEFKITVSNIKYSGTGNQLKLMAGYKDGRFDDIVVNILECKEYEEPVVEPVEPYVPDPVAAPMMIISRGELPANIKAGEEMTVKINVQNIGNTAMQSPVISFTPSDSLMMTGTASMYQLKTIAAGKTESIDIKVRALDEISGQVQYIDAEVKFQYFNRVTTADGSGSGRVTIPAEVKKAKEPEPEVVIDSPVPNLIVESFSYGNSSVAAGSEFNLGFRFINTSRTLDVENVVVTVDGGTSFTLNGAANTVYFNKIEAKGQKTVNVPMKALQTLTNGAEPVMINFKYEYVDKQKRIPASADVKITVPVYQPDRFEITAPTAPVVVYAGEELALTMNYVNKGKSPVNNLEAKVEGISSITPVQNLGNIEAGRSGTMAFAVTPQEAGEAEFSFIISYEDANGESKERIFPVVVNVEEMVFEDTGMEEPMFEPEPEKNVPWTLIGGISAVIAAAAAFLILKKRKKAKAAKAAQMWDSWDDEEEAEQPAATEGNKEGK